MLASAPQCPGHSLVPRCSLTHDYVRSYTHWGVPRHPLLYAALAFSVGIVSGVYVWRPPTSWLVTAVAFLIAALHFSQRSGLAGRAISLAARCACGALSIQLRTETAVPHIDRFLNGREVTVTAYVVGEGNLQQAGFGGLQQSIDLTTEGVSTNLESADVSFGLRLHVYGKTPKSSDHREPSA